MRGGRIARIVVHEVVVPAHPGAIESPGLNKPLHKLPIKGQQTWTVQFDEVAKAILELEVEDGTIGLGELYRDHDWRTVDSIARQLLELDIDELCRQDLPFARCREYDGFETAIWDAYAKAHGMRVVDLLGGAVRDRVLISAWSGQRRTEEVGEVAAGYHEAGYRCLKFKCDLDDDVVGWCAAVAEHAPGLQVILDPNERFERPHEARRLAAALGEIGNILCLEDPIPHHMRAGYAELRRAGPIPIARHVALPYPSLGNRIDDALTAVSNGEVDGFNFNAGLADFQRLDHITDVAGLPCWHGGELDLGVLEAAYMHSCAAARSCTWPSEILGRSIRSHDLLAQPLELQPPYAVLPSGPGLGVELDHNALAEYRTEKREYYL